MIQTKLEFLKKDAELYDEQNPEIWEFFQKFSLQMINRGYSRIGSKMIFERIRWETMIIGKGIFKVNNNYTPYYARKFERLYPHFEGIFAKRESAIEY